MHMGVDCFAIADSTAVFLLEVLFITFLYTYHGVSQWNSWVYVNGFHGGLLLQSPVGVE